MYSGGCTLPDGSVAVVACAGPLAQPTIHLEPKEGFKAIEGISTLILDCDGVLWRGNEVIPGTREVRRALRASSQKEESGREGGGARTLTA